MDSQDTRPTGAEDEPAPEHSTDGADPESVRAARSGAQTPPSRSRTPPSSEVKKLALVILTGVLAGFLSGLFGVGGGLIIVPALMAILGLDQRRASATSLVAIIPTAAAGSASYAMSGNVSFVAMLILILGALAGAQIGVLLLRRLPDRILPWIFVAFVLFVIISQRFHVPVRDAGLELDWYRSIALIVVGLLSGILSGLVGVGGGSVIVPGMEIVVGVGDLLARGTSLLVMIPTAISGTVTNVCHGLAELKTGLILGAAAAVVAPGGALVAGAITPELGDLLFSCFLLFVVAQTLLKARRRRVAEERQ